MVGGGNSHIVMKILPDVKGVLNVSQVLSYMEIQYSEILDHVTVLQLEKLTGENTKKSSGNPSQCKTVDIQVWLACIYVSE